MDAHGVNGRLVGGDFRVSIVDRDINGCRDGDDCGVGRYAHGSCDGGICNDHTDGCSSTVAFFISVMMSDTIVVMVFFILVVMIVVMVLDPGWWCLC